MELKKELEKALNLDLSEYYLASVSVYDSSDYPMEFLLFRSYGEYYGDVVELKEPIGGRIRLGSVFAKFIPEKPLNFDKSKARNLLSPNRDYRDDFEIEALYFFYTYCNSGELNYTEDVFIEFFSFFIDKLPNFILEKERSPEDVYFIEEDELNGISSSFNFDDYLQKIKGTIKLKNDYRYCRKYDIETFLFEHHYFQSYFLAIAYELVKYKYTVNKCAECGKWFVAYNKSDTKYCPDCSEERTTLKRANNTLKQEYLKRCKKREKCPSVYNSDFPEDKKYYVLEAEIVNRYNEANTIPEMQEYSKWLKSLRKIYFPKAKGD